MKKVFEFKRVKRRIIIRETEITISSSFFRGRLLYVYVLYFIYIYSVVETQKKIFHQNT